MSKHHSKAPVGPLQASPDPVAQTRLGTPEQTCVPEQEQRESRRKAKRHERLRLREGIQQLEGVGVKVEGDARQRTRFGFCGAGAVALTPEMPEPAVMIRTRQDGLRRASMTGVQRCLNGHLCAMCAPLVRQQRAQEVRYGIERHQEAGGGVGFVTFTVRHDHHDLVPLRGGLTKAFSQLQASRAWRDFKADFDYIGMVKTVDITHSEASGWHPHIHAVVFTETPLTEADISLMQQRFSAQWAKVVEKHLGSAHVPRTDNVGVDVRTADEGAGAYLARVEGQWDVAAEMTRSDAKTGKAGSRVIADIMRSAIDPDSPSRARDIELVQEFAEAMHRVPILSWSRGLKLALRIAEMDDEQALEKAQESADSDGGDSAIVKTEKVYVPPHIVMDPPPPARVVSEWLDVAERYGAYGLQRLWDGLSPEQEPAKAVPRAIPPEPPRQRQPQLLTLW